MPDMDGFTLARAIRADACAARARVPIIALTASVLDRTREACRDAGIEHFLAKPAHDAGGSVAAFGHGGHHQVGATHRIAAGEQAWMRGLERQAVLATGHDAAVRPAFHAVLGQPRRQPAIRCPRSARRSGGRWHRARPAGSRPRSRRSPRHRRRLRSTAAGG
ncbi:hypothetical protein G6F63_014184 [Rhizopus arrhizus]|nr:hypothetical protein G6F63_014184 [Rhizopus arrhizus]